MIQAVENSVEIVSLFEIVCAFVALVNSSFHDRLCSFLGSVPVRIELSVVTPSPVPYLFDPFYIQRGYFKK